MDVEASSGRVRSVVGVLDNGTAVDGLLSKLAEMGVGPDDISVMTRDGGTTAGNVAEPRSSIISGGAATGAALGGLLGGLAGWMISIGALAIPGVLVPGVGLVFGAGTLASLLTGIAVGAAAGGLIGALLGLGVPEDEARQYEQYLKTGRTLVTVHLRPGQDDSPVVAAFEESGAYDVRVYEAPVETRGLRTLTVATPVAEELPGREKASEDAISGEEIHLGSEGDEQTVGEVSAHTDALGSGAEGGLGTGETLGEEPMPVVSETDPGTADHAPDAPEYQPVIAESDEEDLPKPDGGAASSS